MEILIRKMVQGDWEYVASIYKQGIDTNLATFQNCIPSYEEWDNSHLTTCRYVVISNDKVVGWAALSAVSSRCVYAGVAELSIYIDNDFKGKGVGTKLLMHIIKEGESCGIWTIQAGIMQDNKASIELHKKCGFRAIGYREKIGKDRNGIWRNTLLMEKRSTLDIFS